MAQRPKKSIYQKFLAQVGHTQAYEKKKMEIKNPESLHFHMVGSTGLEPVASTMST
ncbi:MAG: hypothetical protein XD49_0474 [Caldanaerobacter subterraneus]|nr:MAG: hypothetical protein XD49_0474 [Caldanaerobacter subterraneus]MDI3519089.1 hypothetical protein [Caldanaerobacter sp.]